MPSQAELLALADAHFVKNYRQQPIVLAARQGQRGLGRRGHALPRHDGGHRGVRARPLAPGVHRRRQRAARHARPRVEPVLQRAADPRVRRDREALVRDARDVLQLRRRGERGGGQARAPLPGRRRRQARAHDHRVDERQLPRPHRRDGVAHPASRGSTARASARCSDPSSSSTTATSSRRRRRARRRARSSSSRSRPRAASSSRRPANTRGCARSSIAPAPTSFLMRCRPAWGAPASGSATSGTTSRPT